MGFWDRLRKNEDPLLEKLLDTYRLNLLSIPREKASVGDLYVQEGNSQYVSTPGSITNFLDPPFEVPPITTGETMAGVSGATSRDASGKVGIDFLEGFLNALGPAGIGTKVRGSYESDNKKKITFTFENPTRDYVDPGLVGRKLVDHTLMKRHALIAEGRKYYLVTAVARSSGISITTEGESKQVVDIDAQVMKLANVSGDVSIQKNQTGSVTFKGQKNLAFGVELYELEYVPSNGGQEGKFLMSTQEKAVVARGEDEEKEVVPLFGPDNDVSIEVK
jgi:hypothetical protein